MLPSASGGADRVQQLTVGTLLQHIRGDAGAEEFVQVGLISMASQNDHLQLWPAVSQGSCRKQAARSRHRQVHDDQIDILALPSANRLITRTRLCDNGHVWLL